MTFNKNENFDTLLNPSFSSPSPKSSLKMPYFAVYAPDYTDEDAINRRLAVRETHLANAAKNPAISALLPLVVEGRY